MRGPGQPLLAQAAPGVHGCTGAGVVRPGCCISLLYGRRLVLATSIRSVEIYVEVPYLPIRWLTCCDTATDAQQPAALSVVVRPKSGQRGPIHQVSSTVSWLSICS